MKILREEVSPFPFRFRRLPRHPTQPKDQEKEPPKLTRRGGVTNGHGEPDLDGSRELSGGRGERTRSVIVTLGPSGTGLTCH